MARVLSRVGKVMVCATVNGTYKELNGAKEITFNGNRSEIKTTSHDDGDFESYLPGRIDGMLDCKLFYDDTTSSGQELVNDAWLSGAKVFVHWVSNPKTGGKAFYGSGFVTKHEEASGDNDALQINTSIRLSGTFTSETQSVSDALMPGVVASP